MSYTNSSANTMKVILTRNLANVKMVLQGIVFQINGILEENKILEYYEKLKMI